MAPILRIYRTRFSGIRAICLVFLMVFFCASDPPSVRADPDSPKERKLLSLQARAERAFKSGRYHQALSIYNTAARITPPQSRIFLGRGMTYEMLKKPAKAALSYRKAIEVDPNNYRAMENLAGILELSGKNVTEAVELYTRSLALDPRPEWRENLLVWIEMLKTRFRPRDRFAVGLWDLGNEQVRAGDLDAAESAYSSAILLDPLMFQAFHSRGLLRLQRADAAGAVEDFTETIRVSPRFPGIFVRRGLALERIGEYGPALEDFHRAVELHQRDPEARYHLGRSLHEHRRFREAVQSYQAALRLKSSPDLRSLLVKGLAAARTMAARSRARRGPSPTPFKPLW